MIQRWIARQFARPSGLLGKWVIAPWLDRIGAPLGAMAFDLLEPQRGEALLEIGFGGGALLTRLLAAHPQRLVAVDRSREMVERARKRFGSRVEFLHARAEQLNLTDAAFDAVVSVSVIHFWRELDEPLAQIARVLRPGGRLVLVFETPESLRSWPGHHYGFELWSADEVIAAAARAGLSLDERREGRGRKPDCFVGLRLRKAQA